MSDTITERREGEDRRAGAGDRRVGAQLAAAFWVADALFLGLALFFAVVGGALLESTAFAIVLIVAAVLLGVHGLMRHRRRHELGVPDRRVRERRGF